MLYPVFFLFQAALDVGDPQVRPPTAYGFDNFSGILQYPQILLNTLTVSVAATVMALVFGFVMAWILTRTNVPGRQLFEQLMAVPYYLTPLLGALAWSLLGSPESGFINQVWRAKTCWPRESRQRRCNASARRSGSISARKPSRKSPSALSPN